jgi:hypothetical protein
MTLISMPGVKVDAVDSKGATLLHRVVDEIFVDAAALLLDKGADISLKDKEGGYPLTPTSPRVLRDVFAKSTDALRKDLQTRRDTTAVMPPLPDSEHALYTPLQAIAEHTLCLNSEDKAKMSQIYSAMLSYHDYPTTLVMAGIALAALDGMDIFVAHGKDVFTIDAFPNCQDMAGFYANSHNIIALSNIDTPLYAARVFFHEGLHALLYKMDKQMAHNGKPYPHGDKQLKQEYVDTIEASKHIPIKISPETVSTPHSFVRSRLIKDVESSYLYSKHSSKLQEYIVRAGEVHLYGLQLPVYRQGAEEAAGPLLTKAFRQDFVKMLEQHVLNHPKFSQLNLPYHMQIKLETAKNKDISPGVLAI